ncbi:MAG: hypothetical protein CFE45_13790 [Burkholderiales bacterium PBB5]|nr:MAG: hypothetical protein CFE45_13790 [Burkholderiales bacterium PBB5]
MRLRAEDPARQCMPQSGRLAAGAMPETGPGALRVEHGLRPGEAVPPYYDSMIAKLVAHGRSRGEALRKLAAGLQQVVALGLATNQDFLAACIRHPVFAVGGATTAFIAEHQDALLTPPDAQAQARAAAAAVALRLLVAPGASAARPHGLPRLQRLVISGQALSGSATVTAADALTLAVGEHTVAVQVLQDAPGVARLIVDGLASDVPWAADGAWLWLRHGGLGWAVQDRSLAAADSGVAGASDGRLRASLSGRVVALQVAVGDVVKAGQPLLTLEAMKMEHQHSAPCDGTVTALSVALGDQVAGGRVLLAIGD